MEALTLLNVAKANGLQLVVQDDGLVVRGPKASEHVVETLRKHKATLLAYLRSAVNAGDATEQPAVTVTPISTAYVATGTVATEDLIGWFQANRNSLPREPYRLNGWCVVSNPETFHESLDRDVSGGSAGARARGLAADIGDLRAVIESRGRK